VLSICLIGAAKFDSLSEARAAIRHYAKYARVALFQTAADTTVYYGPKQFVTVKSNNQINFVESFSVPAIPPVLIDSAGNQVWAPALNRYTMRIQRVGGSLTTATVAVNGTQVATIADFASVSYIERSISPRQIDFFTNSFTVALKGTVGAGLKITIVGAADATFGVFGPKVYTKTATTPTHFVESFTPPSGASAPYSISAQGSVAGTTATITVNGVQVIKDSDFGNAITYVSKPVTLLSGSNAMLVDVIGSTGTTITLTVWATDNTPPTLTIAAPPPNFVTNASTVTVSGTSQDREETQVTVNGVIASMSGTPRTQFSVTVPLSQGANSIAIQARDKAGNHTDSTRTVTRDTVAPTLTVTSPADGSYTNHDAVTVAGTVSDASTVTVKVNGVSLAVGQGGAFTGSYTLADGANFLTITATDAGGNVTSQVRKVTQAKQPPVLTVTAPIDGFAKNTTPLAVTGTVTGTTPITVSANGVAMTVTGSSFTGSVPLIQGANDIAITATDPAGNTTVVHRTGNLDTHAPVLTLTAPTDASYSNATTATVSGTATDESSFTVTVNGTPVTVAANGSFTQAVTLAAGANAITVTATDAATNATTLQRSVTQDRTPPTLTVTAPADGSYSNATAINVSGTASDASPLTMKVNGSPATVNPDGSFTYSAALAPGTNTLSVVATDAASNATTVSRTVVQDLVAPTLDVDIPVLDSSGSSLTNAQNAVVIVTAMDASPISVTVNGVPVTVDANGKYIVSLPLSEGWNYVSASVTDAAGNDAPTLVVSIYRDTQPPVINLTSPADGAHFDTEPVVVSGTINDSNNTKNSFTLTVNGASVAPDCSDVGTCSFSTPVHLAVGSNTISVVVREGAGNSATVTRTVTFGGVVEGVPPDPATVAPTLDATIATTTLAATSFLYTGSNPIQTGVAAETIQRLRAAELRGVVKTRAGSTLPGVKITVLGHPEFGQTLSRADGAFDFVVNGGGLVTVNYEKDGYLPAQRQAVVQWQDYVRVDSVTLVNLDAASTVVDFSQPAQAAQGSSVTDESGTRRATMIFKGGTHASLTMPDGTTQSVPSLTIRATEFTVGPTGPSAMPGALPGSSAYTYAVELSSDEAIAAGATGVVFDRPVPVYIDNFLNFPTGIKVPVGFYDRAKAAWIGSQDGRVVKILSITNGQAVLDVDGSGSAASPAALAALGIDDAELAKLAELYQAGKTLWRIQVTHFTPWDCNWPVTFPPGAKPPKVENPDKKKPSNKDCPGKGSIIGCERQTLGERLAVAGTSLGLNYVSDGTPGYKDAYQTDIPLGADSLPPGVLRIDLEVRIAGQDTIQSFSAQPNQSVHFVWDGKDLFGRTVQGVQQAHIRIGYVYPPVYADPQPAGSGGSSFGGWGNTPVSGDRSRNEVTMWQEMDITLGSRGTSGSTLGGWSLDVHHSFDPEGRILYLGNGTKRAGGELPVVTTTLAGVACTGYDDTYHCVNHAEPGARASDVYFDMEGVGLGSDGSMYLADLSTNKIWRVNAGGTLEHIAGNGTQQYNGDGISATSAGILPAGPQLAVGSDNSVYFLDYTGAGRIRRVDKNGIITSVVGNGTCSSDSVRTGIPAIQAKICVSDFALAKDGTLYVIDGGTSVFRVGADGIITRIVGNGSYATSAQCPGTVASYTCAEGKPASATAVFHSLTGIAVGPDGSLFLSNLEFRGGISSIIYRIGADGIIRRFAGSGAFYGSFAGLGNGRLATDAVIHTQYARPVIGPDGTLYFGEIGYVGHVDQKGVLRLVAGCIPAPAPVNCVTDGGQRATATSVSPRGLDFGPDGRLYMIDAVARRIDKPMPALDVSDVLVASEDGSQLYVFNVDGRHLRTLDALLGHTIYDFAYDAAGLLSTITDVDGNVVRVERDGTGAPTAIVAPFGQRTELTLNSGKYLVSVKRPGEPATLLTYDPDGLLKTFTDRNNNLHQFTYDGNGLLIRDDNAAGGFKTLARTVTDSSSAVTVTTAMGRSTTQSTTRFSNGGVQRTSIDGSGLATSSLSGPNGTVTLTAPDGTITTVATGADPRLGMQAQVSQSATAVTPGGVRSTITRRRTVQLQDPRDRLSVISQIDSTIINGHVYTSTFTKSDRSVVSRSPEGRTSAAYFDAAGHLVRTQSSGLAATTYSYDPRGRLSVASRGGRDIRYTYDAQGRLAKIAAPLGDSVSYTYDLAGRLTRARYADGREATYAYDNNGNLTSVVPPESGGHSFTFTPADLNDAYLPPSIGGDSGVVRYSYDNDQRLNVANRSDGTATTFGYDAGGRLASVLMPDGTRSISYNAVGGRVSSLTNSSNGSVLSYGYDGALALTASLSGQVQGSVAVAYDADARISSVTINGANPVDHHYDADGLLTSIGAMTLTRNAQTGIPTAATIGGVARTWAVDSLGNVSRTDAQFSATPFFAATYTPDSLDRISALTETVQGTSRSLSYSYNSTGRLTEVREGGILVATYDYDANGNWLHETGPTGTITSTYDAQDRLLSHGTTRYSYTANGELRLKIAGTDTTKYQYDPAGSLLRITLPTGTSIEYVLDPTGRRVGRKVNGALVQGFLYSDKLSPVAELDGQNNVVSQFVYGIGRTVPGYMVKSGVTYALITDHIGSVRLVVNCTTGAIAQRLDYDAWGRVTQNTNPGFQPFGFAGGLYDETTGLVRFGARDYDAESGRWTTKDPLGFGGGANAYRYVGDDPVNVSDPSGLWPAHGALNAAAQFSAGFGDLLTGGLTRLARKAIDADDVVDRCSSWYKGGEAAGLAAGLALGGALAADAAAGEAVAAEAGEETLSVFHGSISDATAIAEDGLDAARTPTWVTRDLEAAQDAIGPGRVDPMTDPGIIESRIPASEFDRLLAPGERPYSGFNNGLPGSSEIVLRNSEQIDLFNLYRVP